MHLRKNQPTELVLGRHNYNNSHRRTIDTTPNRAAKPLEHTKLNIERNTTSMRQYIELTVAGEVRYLLARNKRKDTDLR